MKATNKAVKTVGIMFILTFSGKIIGQIREIFLASFYGTGYEAAAFTAASQVPLHFFDIAFGAAIASSFIPIFNEYLEKGDKKQAIDFSNHFVNIIFVFACVISVVGVLFARPILSVITPGLNAETFALTVQLLRVLFPMIIFTGLAFAFVGILQSFSEFTIPASISLLSNLVIIIYFIFFNERFGIYGLAVAMLIGWSTQVVVQIPALIKKGYRYRWVLSIKHEGIKKVGALALPVLISTWVQPVNVLVNIRLASYLNEGKAIASLNYANKLYIIIVGVFTFALTNFLFPSLSRMSAGNHKEEFARVMNRAVQTVMYFIFPLMIGFMVLRVPLIRLIYERGEFDAFSTQLTSTALLFYSIGMLGLGIQDVMNKGFYALHDAAIPMKISIGGIILNIVLSVVFVHVIGTGIGGLALAASIAAVVISVLLVVNMQAKIKGVITQSTLKHLLKTAIASLLMGGVVLWVYRLIAHEVAMTTIDKILNLAVPAVVGVMIYGIMSIILRMEEAKFVMQVMKDKFRKGA